MYVGTKKNFMEYDQALLDQGNTIEELVDLASDALYKHLHGHQSYAFLIGPGNNGADGLSLGLKLARDKKEVQFYCFADQLSQANRYYLDQASQFGVPIASVSQDTMASFQEEIGLYDAIVDCMFGFGLNKPVTGVYEQVVEYLNEKCSNPIVAIDIPSGMYCDTFMRDNPIVKADMTVTLTALKQSFLNPKSEVFTGKIVMEYLDVPGMHERLGFAKILDASQVVKALKKRGYDDYKHRNGLVVHFTGSSKYRGAGVLAAKAALLSGSGIVAVSTIPEVEQAICAHAPEVIFDFQNETGMERGLAKYDAILVGSGLGISLESIKTTFSVLEYARVPVVVDGDGLTILAKRQEVLKHIRVPVILTPHMGEFRRFCDIDEYGDVMATAVEFAKRNRVILVLKGPNTIVTDGNRVYRNSTGNPAMATAGSGDVLAGILSSFLGQGYEPLVAAWMATFIHGLAGDKVAASNYMATAGMVIDMIPNVLKQLEDRQSNTG